MKIKHLIFDLDNTLYKSASRMDKGVSKRMLEFVASFFKVSYEEAVSLRHKYIGFYSTTLEWLRHEGLKDIDGYFNYVHPIEESCEVPRDDKIRSYLESIPLPKSILTNAPRIHAERVLKVLNISDLFTNIYDIKALNYYGKPYPSSFISVLECESVKIDQALFIDDMVKYTAGYTALGGKSVLVGEKNGRLLSASALPVIAIKEYNGGDKTQEYGLKEATYRIKDIYGLKSILDYSI